MTNIKENLQVVRSEIARALERRKSASRDEVIKLIAVTKNHEVEAMRIAIDEGAAEIGENRVQEAAEKYKLLDRQVTWHLIGHLQTNKAKQAVKIFDLIHSIDSEHIAESVNRAAKLNDKIQEVLIQVNLAKEDTKSGIYVEELDSLVEKVDELENLKLRGLMMIAPNYEDVEKCRPLFSEMYEIFQRLRQRKLKRANIKYLSMGMTNDYKIAIEEGANIVRVGTAIFGQRNYN